MINYERQFLQSWDEVFYPRGPEMPEEEAQPVQVAQAPVEGEGGAAFGVFPAARSRSRAPTSEAAKMMVPDVAAGALKGAITGSVGMAGDLISIIRGVHNVLTQAGQQDKLDAFLAGMEKSTGLPTSEDVSKWLDANVGPVVPPGAPMARERAGVAAAGQFAGELASSPAALVKGAAAGGRAAKATAKFVAPKVGEMLDSYMRRAGLTPELMAFHGTPHRFAAEEGAPLGRFRSEKIGTGEGAQAQGYGLYFAESPGVAKGYQSALSGYSADGKRLPSDIGMVVSNYKGDVAAAIADRQSQLDKWLATGADSKNFVVKSLQDEIKKLSALQGKRLESTGSFYTVDIPDEVVGKMIDYDKPLSSQPAELQSKLKSVVDAEIGPGVWESWIKNEPDFRSLKDDLFENKTDAEVSALLRDAGVPGVRYLDRQSRPTSIMDKRLQGLFEKHNGDIEKTVNEYMRSIYDTPKVKEKIRAGVVKQLETPITRNIVVFPGEEDKVKILKVE